MPMIPAFCDTCGTAFPSGFFMENCTNIHLSSNRSGPCPKCGGSGHVPDGVFNIIGDAIHIVSAPSRTKQELRRFAEVLEVARATNKSVSAVKEELESTLPDLSGIMKYAPESKAEWLAFIGVMLALIQVYLAAFPPSSGQQQPGTPNITVNQIIEQTLVSDPSNVGGNLPRQKVGRNEPCPCNSGKKYKKCCGTLK